MPDSRRVPLYYAAGMVALLVVFSVVGDNGGAYVAALLGVPIGSGILAGRGLIRFWHAVAGCLSVVAVDVVLDDSRAEDVAFFVVLALVMVGLAALARLATRRLVQRR